MNQFAQQAIKLYGVKSGSKLNDVISVMIKTEEDLNELKARVISKKTRFSPVFFAVAEMRKERVEKHLFNEEQFIQAFKNNPVKALETLFVERIYERDIKFLKERIKEGYITLSDLYHKHVMDLEYPMVRHIL